MRVARGLPLAAPVSIAILIGMASSVFASPGVALRWDHCYSEGGPINREFACNANSGTNTLIESFELAEDMCLYPKTHELVLDLVTAGAALPAWWEYKNTGSCRPSSLTIANIIPADANNCVDWASGQGATSFSYAPGIVGPNSARIVATTSVPVAPTVCLFTGTEYFSLRIRFDNLKTVGTGSCESCATPVCLVIQSVKLSPDVPGHDQTLTTPMNGTDSHYATWQGGGIPVTSRGTGCPAAVPTRRETWGAVKALYR